MKNFFKHLHTVNKHRFLVFKLAVKAGIPFRGFVHDLSKYSPTEFLESIKYYKGIYSPIVECRRKKGYSLCWLHHRSRNKHHFQYWYDEASREIYPMPYKYAVEMICDRVSAAITYNGKNYTNESPYNYFVDENKEYVYMINPKIYKFMEQVFTDLKDYGEKYVFNRKYLKKTYHKIVEGEENDRNI
ncbi:MAG: catalase [Bacilli bacterium]|nr:catalase [Bacilli bacterium]